MAQISATGILYDWVTKEQYDILVFMMNDFINGQYAHLFESFTFGNIPPTTLQIPITIKVNGLTAEDAATLVADRLTVGFGDITDPTTPVISIDISNAI